MVSQREKKQAIQFLGGLLENSKKYFIFLVSEKELSAQERKEVREKPRRINVVMPNFLGTIAEFNQHLRSNASQEVYTVPVFYKDGKTAFVRMVERNLFWRTDKSLKRYTPQQINQMLHLRGIEKAVMEHYGTELSYYQSPAERLEESVRAFKMLPVELDYSHISQWDERYGFVENGTSIDYKLPQEMGSIISAAGFLFFENERVYLKRAKIMAAPLSYQRLIDEYFAVLEKEAGKRPEERDVNEIESALERIAIMAENEPLDSENSKGFRHYDALLLEPIRQRADASETPFSPLLH